MLYILININNHLTYLQCINKSISVYLYLYVCLGVCVPVSLSASLFLYVCLHPGRLCPCICLFLSVCLHVCLSVCISVCSCVYLPVCAILRVSASGSVRPSVCESAYLYICMGVSIDMSQYLPLRSERDTTNHTGKQAETNKNSNSSKVSESSKETKSVYYTQRSEKNDERCSVP